MWVAGLLPVVPSPSNIQNTPDGGTTWNFKNSGVNDRSLYGLAFTDANNGWVVGDSGAIFRTKDGGTSWNPHTNPQDPRKTLLAIVMPPAAPGVKLDDSASPAGGVAQSGYVSVGGSGFPDGSNNPKHVFVQLAPVCHGAACITTSAVSVVSSRDSTKLVSFQLPAELLPGKYFVSILDFDANDANFASSNVLSWRSHSKADLAIDFRFYARKEARGSTAVKLLPASHTSSPPQHRPRGGRL